MTTERWTATALWYHGAGLQASQAQPRALVQYALRLVFWRLPIEMSPAFPFLYVKIWCLLLFPKFPSLLTAESSACVCLHLLSLTKFGITEENWDGSPMAMEHYQEVALAVMPMFERTFPGPIGVSFILPMICNAGEGSISCTGAAATGA